MKPSNASKGFGLVIVALVAASFLMDRVELGAIKNSKQSHRTTTKIPMDRHNHITTTTGNGTNNASIGVRLSGEFGTPTTTENRMNDTENSAVTDQDLGASLVNSTTSENNQVDDTEDTSEVVTHPASDNEPFTVANTTTTIVVQLSGELGNQLSKISFGLGLQLLAKEKYGIDTVIKLRAQQNSKWMRAKNDTKACFPNTRPLNFQECNTNEFDDVRKQQMNWLGKNDAELLHLIDSENITYVEKGLSFLQTTLRRKDLPGDTKNANANISIPFLYADAFSNAGCFLIDKYYKEIRDYLTFDDTVCKELPDPDETVLHFRNFLTELRKKGSKFGFEELSPSRAASVLFANHTPGDKVAIISRFPNNLDSYKEALEARGLVVRLINGQSGTEDFCFLLRAQKEIIGVATSTYVTFAGILGDAKKVRLYSVDSPARRGPGSLHKLFTHYNYTNEELKSRFQFDLIKAQE